MYRCCSKLIIDWSLYSSICWINHWRCGSFLMAWYSCTKACGFSDLWSNVNRSRHCCCGSFFCNCNLYQRHFTSKKLLIYLLFKCGSDTYIQNYTVFTQNLYTFPECSFLQCFDMVGRQEEHLACKSWVMRCWCGYLSAARCRLFAYGPADATASPNPIISCLIWTQIGFTFLVPAYPGCPGKEAVKSV